MVRNRVFFCFVVWKSVPLDSRVKDSCHKKIQPQEWLTGGEDTWISATNFPDVTIVFM